MSTGFRFRFFRGKSMGSHRSFGWWLSPRLAVALWLPVAALLGLIAWLMYRTGRPPIMAASVIVIVMIGFNLVAVVRRLSTEPNDTSFGVVHADSPELEQWRQRRQQQRPGLVPVVIWLVLVAAGGGVAWYFMDDPDSIRSVGFYLATYSAVLCFGSVQSYLRGRRAGSREDNAARVTPYRSNPPSGPGHAG